MKKFDQRHPLAPIITALEAQATILSRARHRYLVKEAERKHFESKLIQAASGKSHAERMVAAQATDQWLAFHKSLARKEAVFEFQKLKYEVLDKEWLAQYQAIKSDDGLIKKQGA